MSKKYDYNLQEIKETRTFATNTTIDSKDLGTLGVYFERDMLNKKIAELKQQLAEKDKKIESLKNQLEKEACDNLDWEGKCLCLYSMLYETLEKLDPAPNDIASAIQQMTNENFDKQNEQFKSIQSCEELVRQLVEKDKEIERLKQLSREQVPVIATHAYNECLNDLRKFLDQIEKGE